MFDLIGDIHGHADELIRLLQRLGYVRSHGIYTHPSRRVIFLGDYIDRGPAIRETLAIVRGMTERGSALAILGNHEVNALAYHTPDPLRSGEYLRLHTSKNEHQHAQTLRQLSSVELRDALDWFRTLPAWLDLPELRAVHACWDDDAIATFRHALDKHGGFTPSFLAAATRKDDAIFDAVEITLKGKEILLPSGVTFRDKEGYVRTVTRVRWYLAPHGHTFRSYAFASESVESDLELPASLVATARPYPAEAKPVFVGHYWLHAETPGLLAPNVACLDYSVAKGGFLCAYRFDGERTLDPAKFVVVPSQT